MTEALKHDTGKPAFELIDVGAWRAFEQGLPVLGSVNVARQLLEDWTLEDWTLLRDTTSDRLVTVVRHAAALICPPAGMLALRLEVARVLAFGARKYARHNWREGLAWSRWIDAALRHLAAFERGEVVDLETGCHHLGHFACCVMFLYVHQRDGLGTDDRWPKPARYPGCICQQSGCYGGCSQ